MITVRKKAARLIELLNKEESCIHPSISAESNSLSSKEYMTKFVENLKQLRDAIPTITSTSHPLLFAYFP